MIFLPVAYRLVFCAKLVLWLRYGLLIWIGFVNARLCQIKNCTVIVLCNGHHHTHKINTLHTKCFCGQKKYVYQLLLFCSHKICFTLRPHNYPLSLPPLPSNTLPTKYMDFISLDFPFSWQKQGFTKFYERSNVIYFYKPILQ